VSLSLYEKVSLNFGSGVVAVALIGTLSYVSLGKLAVATRSAGDTEAVLEQVDMLRASIADAGVAQRDYVLGGGADARIRFENARSNASRNLERLRAISTMNAVSSARADSLAPVLAAHLDDLGRIANMRQALVLELELEAIVHPEGATKAPTTLAWSRELSGDGNKAVPPLSLETLTEFDPRKCVWREGKWEERKASGGR
jgi:CHASE3 domain sensor protein